MGAVKVTTDPFIPAPTSILGGSTQSTTTATVLITIPAGRTWYGNLGLSLAQAAAATTNGSIQTAGTGVSPAAGTALCAAVDIGVAGAGGGDSMYSDNQYVSAPAGNSVTLVTNWAVAPSVVTAFATGVLL